MTGEMAGEITAIIIIFALGWWAVRRHPPKFLQKLEKKEGGKRKNGYNKNKK